MKSVLTPGGYSIFEYNHITDEYLIFSHQTFTANHIRWIPHIHLSNIIGGAKYARHAGNNSRWYMGQIVHDNKRVIKGCMNIK